MSLLDILKTVSAVMGVLTVLSVVVLSLTLLERKFIGRIQMRRGPNRVGPFGILQPVADAVKLVAKEDILPSWVDRGVYWVSPLVVFVPTFMIWVTIPVARDLVIRNMEMGLFYIIAFSVLSIVGLVSAGWASANKYAVIGGFRAAAQLVSYEIPIILSVLAIAMLAQSLNLEKIVDAQASLPYIFIQPLGAFLFFCAGLAELGRTPFDIHPAESEVVGGPYVEYSGAHWSVFFLAEYINTFAIAALVTLLFLGGWLFPGLPGNVAVTGVLVFLIKTYMVVLVIFWFRGTYPRLRIDQLMTLGWKILVPLAFLNVVITAVALFYGFPAIILGLISISILIGTFWVISIRMRTAPKPVYTVRLYDPTLEVLDAR